MEVVRNKHYIRVDAQNRIIAGFSDAFKPPLDTDICIADDGGRHFKLFGVVNPQLINEQGISIYKYVNGDIKRRSVEEIQTDTNLLPPTEIELLKEKVAMQDQVIEELMFSIIPALAGGGM